MVFASSNTSVATISGNTVTISGAGITTITASQGGDNNYLPAADVSQIFTVNPAKQDQTITFAAPADKTLGDASFSLTASASSGLTVAYSTSSDKVSLSGNQVTLVMAGRTSITASQSGNGSFNPATDVSRSFCINPPKPVVTASQLNTESPLLTSSSPVGNQWFLSGAAVTDATGTTLSVVQAGIYSVQVSVDDCKSAFSEDLSIAIHWGHSELRPGNETLP